MKKRAFGGNLYKIFGSTIWVKSKCTRYSFLMNILWLSQNVLEMLEKYNKEPCVLFIKVNGIFLKGQYGSTRIVPGSSFARNARNRNKRRPFDGNL